MFTTAMILLLMLGSALGGALWAGWRSTLRQSPSSTETNLYEQAIAPGALALLDVDDLAGLNIANDYDTGDRLLDRLEDVLRRSLPEGLSLERLDSGRFLVWFPDIALQDALAPLEQMRRNASNAYVDGTDGMATRTVSAGLVAVEKRQNRSRAILHADAALARAKGLGGDRTQVGGKATAAPTGPFRKDVEEALNSGALRYYVQPIIDLGTRNATAVEALLRWTRDDGEVMTPEGFVDVLDRIPSQAMDLFPDIAEAAARPVLAIPGAPAIAFNITSAVLDGKDSSGCRWLRELLDRLPADRLIFEVVENAVVAQPERARDLAERLRERGVRIALDDFGTGLSNLERLRHFPTDFIKLDRVFIMDLEDDRRSATILQHLVAMTRDLGIEIIAEGIETEAQAAAVAKLGVRYGQGYHFGRPAPVEDWVQRLSAAG